MLTENYCHKMFFLSCFMCVCIFKYNCILLLGAHFQIQVVCIPAWCCVISYHCSLTSPTSSITFPPSFLPPCPSSLTCTPHLSFFIPHLTSLTPHPSPLTLSLIHWLFSLICHPSSITPPPHTSSLLPHLPVPGFSMPIAYSLLTPCGNKMVFALDVWRRKNAKLFLSTNLC